MWFQIIKQPQLHRAAAISSAHVVSRRQFSSSMATRHWMDSPRRSGLNISSNCKRCHRQHRPTIVCAAALPHQIVQQRTYIFLPSSLSDATKLLKTLFDNNKQTHKHLMVKLQSRWQDTLYTFQERMSKLKHIQRKQRKLAKQRAQSAKSSMMNRSEKYSSIVQSMHWRVNFSSRAIISRGKLNLLSHYNAKKRVYARRKITRQLTRKMNSSRTFMERWKSRYWGGRKALLGNFNNNYSNVDDCSHDTTTTTWRDITLTEPTQQSWFDDEGYPLTSRDPETGRFVNPWLSESSNGENGLVKFLRWKVGGAWDRLLNAVVANNSNPGKTKRKTCDSEASTKDEIHTVSTLTDSRTMMSPSTISEQSTQEAISLTWIGHSTTIVQFPGHFTILTDPHFSNYAGPVSRETPPAFRVADLPRVVDCVLISHDHMDHLDYWSILELIESNKVKFWVVPLGIKSWLIDKTGVSPGDVIELEWWEGVRLSKPFKGNCHLNEDSSPEVEGLVRTFDKGTKQYTSDATTYGLPDKNELVITCAPAQHWCSRTPFDRNRRLWCSFAVHATPATTLDSKSQTHSFYFAGDTGLPPEFPLHHQIGDRLGPFDLSAIPSK